MPTIPQFVYPTPDGFQDQDFVHYYDQLSEALLSSALSLSVGSEIVGIPLTLQNDAPFLWRGVKVNGPTNFGIRFRDQAGNYLSEDYVPLPLGYAPDLQAILGVPPVVLEPEIPCHPGGVVWVDVKRLS